MQIIAEWRNAKVCGVAMQQMYVGNRVVAQIQPSDKPRRFKASYLDREDFGHQPRIHTHDDFTQRSKAKDYLNIVMRGKVNGLGFLSLSIVDAAPVAQAA